MTRSDIRIAAGLAAGLIALLIAASGCGPTGSTGSARTAVPGPATETPGISAATSSTSSSQPSPATVAASPATAAPSGPGTCHARGDGLYVLPDPSCTPGATNPAVTQSNISQTICRSGWTATIRPPESYTEPLKYRQMAAYGDTGPAGDYEEDHLISLELGGSPTSPDNLWPEPGGSPNPKDSVEDAAKRAVCAGRMTLAAAQHAISADWIVFGQQFGLVPPPTSSTPPASSTPPTSSTLPASSNPAPSSGIATCTASASYSSRYGDWDVYVRSDQPGQIVTVTASGGETASYHTNSSGYADVYLHAPAGASGQRVTVTVGGATCTTAL